MHHAIEIGSAADWFSGTMALGAIVTSLWLAGRSTREQKRRDATARRNVAMKTMAKLLIVVNNATSSAAYLSAPAVPPRVPTGRHKWSFVKGIANMIADDQLMFDADEFGLLMDGGESKLAMDISLLFRRHAAAIAAMRHYTETRERLLFDLPLPFEVDGTEAAVVVEGAEGRRLQVRAAALDRFLEGMIETAKEDLDLANRVRDRIGPALRTILNDPRFPILGIPATSPSSTAHV